MNLHLILEESARFDRVQGAKAGTSQADAVPTLAGLLPELLPSCTLLDGKAAKNWRLVSAEGIEPSTY
jgi:hypothetical protein